MNSSELAKPYTGTHDWLWDSEIDSTSSESSIKYGYVEGVGHINIWDFVFKNETATENIFSDREKSLVPAAQSVPAADFGFHKKNNDRLELLIRKYSENSSTEYAKEESARLGILNRQIELANQRFTDSDFAAVDDIFSHLKNLRSFKADENLSE